MKQGGSGIGFGEKNLTAAGSISHGEGDAPAVGPEGAGSEPAKRGKGNGGSGGGATLCPKDLVQILALACYLLGDLGHTVIFRDSALVDAL